MSEKAWAWVIVVGLLYAASHGWPGLIVAGIVLAVGHAVACWWWPFTDCRKCKGNGQFRSPTGKNKRRCPKCGGGGQRVRTGRLIWRKVSGKS